MDAECKQIIDNFRQALPSKVHHIHEIKQLTQDTLTQIDHLFWQNKGVHDCIAARVECVDTVILALHANYDLQQCSVYAIGGYGRKLLYPASDIDLLILHQDLTPELSHHIADFLADIWDIGLQPSPQVTNNADYIELLQQDLSAYTSAISWRALTVQKSEETQLPSIIDKVNKLKWSNYAFLKAKLKEQKDRYKNYDHTSLKLEPSIKDSPGGLRDCDMLYWFSLKFFQSSDCGALVTQHILAQAEYESFSQALTYLRKLRYGLHLLSQGQHDRLYFERQESLAKKWHYQGDLNTQLRLFMQEYYRSAAFIRQTTNYICQYMLESLSSQDASQDKTKINHWCVLINQYLEIYPQSLNINAAQAILMLFLFYAKDKTIKGFASKTIRWLHAAIDQINPSDWLNNPEVLKTFLTILKQAKNCARTLSLMKEYGVLPKLIPEFSGIMGQLQYDLYHVNTVDAHTLLVLWQVQKYFSKQPPEHFPDFEACLVEKAFAHILYCAGLFHDIGKGQGGNHAKLGAEYATAFCHRLSIPPNDTEMVVWLVENHLVMSETAQTEDISDFEVIERFAAKVQDLHRLQLLYLLTVADIIATNPQLWNSWRAALLRDLYRATKQWLNDQQQPEYLHDHNIKHNKQAALKVLQDEMSAEDIAHIKTIWQGFPTEYFEQMNAQNLAWQSQLILQSSPPIIGIRPHWNKVGTDLFIYSLNRPYLFASLSALFAKIFLSVVEARIITTQDDYCINNFVVLESSGQPITGPQRLKEIKTAIKSLLKPLRHDTEQAAKIPLVSRKMPRFFRFFKASAKVKVTTPKNSKFTHVVIHAPDYPGLLARVAQSFVECQVKLHNAKINTLGNKVEDIFLVTDKETNLPLTDLDTIKQLEQSLYHSLQNIS